MPSLSRVLEPMLYSFRGVADRKKEYHKLLPNVKIQVANNILKEATIAVVDMQAISVAWC